MAAPGFDHETWNDPQFAFAMSAVVMGAVLWHIEPDDPIKVQLLHDAVVLFNRELEMRDYEGPPREA